MTTTTTWSIDGTTTPASVARRMLAGLVSSAGIDAEGALAVSERAAGANNTWDVAAGGVFFLKDGEVWHAWWDDANIPATPADPDNPRIDLIVAELRVDGVNDDAILRTVTGVPGGVPNEPAAPDDAEVLYRVDVPANQPSMVDAYLTDRREPAQLSAFLSATPVVSKAVVLSSDTASALSTVEQWGTETVTFDDPGHAVTIDAKLVGRFRYNQSAESRRVGTVYIEISLDGGGSWDRSAGVVSEVSGGNQRGTAMADLHVVSGTPTGQIRVRAMIEQALGTAGDADFTLGKLTAQQMRA